MNQEFLPFMPNEFDEAQSPTASIPHTEEFEPIMPAGYDENTTIVRTRQAANRTPDIAAADMLLADSFGQPADMVSRNRGMFKQMEMDKQVNSVLASAPIVRGVYNSSDSHAALMRDDLENAVGLETLFAERVKPFTPPSTKGLYGGEHAALTTTPKNALQPQGFIERLPTVAMEGVQSMGHNVLSFINAVSENMSLDPNANNYVEGTARDEDSGQRQLATFLQGQKQTMADNRLIPTGDWGQDFTEDVVRMGPQVAGQMATYALGGWVPSLLFMGSQLAGGQYSELTEDEAIDKGRAFLASLANAGLQTPLETLAVGKALEVLKASGIGKLVRSGLGAMATEFVTEWTQAYPEALTTLWAEAEARGRSTGDSFNVFLDRLGAITQQGMYEGAVASVYGIVGGSGKVAYEHGKYKAGVADGNFFAALDESAKSSKIRERLPKAYAQLVDNITTGGPVQNVYIAPQAMREAAGDDAAFYQLAATVGLTQEAVARAEELGADLEIPLPLYQAHIAGTDTSLAMRESVKFRPEDMTFAERLSFEHEAPAQLADALHRMKADNAAHAELDAALAPVAAQLGTVYGKEATQENINLLKARAVIAADWWTQAGESLSPAQVVTDKWGLTLEILDQKKENANADLYHAMYRNKATTPQAFVDEVMAGTPQDKKSFLGIGYASREDITLVESEIVLASDQVRHIRDGHPDFAEWERIPEVIQHGEVVRLSKNRVTGEDAYAFVLHEGDSSLVALGSPTQSKKTGNRLTILTAFRDSPEGIKNWLEQKNTAMYQSAAEITASPSPARDLPSGSGGMSAKNLNSGVPPVNTSPRGSMFTDASTDLFQAMNKSTATSIDDFMAEAREGGIVFRMEEQKPEAARKALGIDNLVVNIPYDFVQHLDNQRPNDASALVRGVGTVLANADVITETGKDRRGAPVYSAVKYTKDVAEVVVFSLKRSTKKGNRVVPITAFIDKASAVNYVLNQRNRAATSTVVGGGSNLPKPLNEDEIRVLAALDENILYTHGAVNTSPRGAISFTDAGAVVRLFRDSADLSTFAHESAHLFMHDMQALVSTGNAPPQVVEDMEKLQGFVAEYDDAATLQSFYEQGFQPARPSFAGKGFASLVQEEVAQVRNVAQQEKLADAFLTYLQEGRAPSPELRSAFRRFKDWLKGLYQNIMGTVQINDDVRGVFDRMLSTDADMALVEALHEQESANAAAVDKAGYTALWEMLTDAEARQLRDAQHEAGATSREARLSASLRLYMHSLLGKKEITAKAQNDIAAQPVYAAMDLALSEGGLSRESVVAEFDADTAIALNKKQRGLVKKSGGLDVHDLAMVCDFASAEDMIQTMMNATPKAMAVSTKVKAELTKREAELRQSLQSDPEQNSLAGEEDYYNDSRLTALLLELRAMERRAGRKIGANAGTAGMSRQWAQDILGAMPVRDALHVGRHAAAEARAAAESAKALAEGRAKDAAAAKRRQAVNHAMVLEALELRKKQDSIHKALRRWEKSKTMDFACREQIMALAQRYNVGGTVHKGSSRFAPVRPDELLRLGTFMEALTEDDTFGMPPFSDFLLNESVPSPLTLEQMQETWDCMRWLAEQGSPGEAQLITGGVSGSVKAAAVEGAAVLKASGNSAAVHEEGTKTRALSDKWRHIFASLNEFKDMMMRADGYQEIGPQGSHRKGFHSQWFQRLKESNDELSRIYRQEVMPEQRRIEMVRYDFIQRFNKSLGKRAASINGVEPPQNMKDVGRSAWTAEHIWCLARNMGNAGNLKTLHEGYGLSISDLRSLTSILTAKEWQAIQAEGNLVGSFYERTDAVFRKVYGRPMPDKVQPQTLDVVTADGQSLSLEGWYFPIAVDGKLAPDVKDKGQVDMLQSDPTFTAFGPSLARNHTKGRSGTGKPVGLYFDVFERAVQDQLRFMTHAPALKDFDRITRNPEWRKAYVQAFGQQAYDQLRPKLKYLARPYGENQGALEGWIARSRQLATLYILGHNVKTFVRQFQGFSPAQAELGGGWIARGMGRVYRHPLAAVDAVNALSPFMADRQKGYDRELRQALRGYKARVQVKVGGKLYSEQDVQAFTMGLITVGDCATVYPIWQGAYIKAQDMLNMGQKEAVAYADSIVQKTNASASPIDLTPIQQKDGLWRLFTMFMGEGLRKGSRMRYWWGALQAGKIGMFQYAQHVAMESLVPALYFVALVGLFADDEPDRGDLAVAVASELIGPYPFLGSIPSALQYNKPLMHSPVFTGVDAAMKTVKSTKGIWDTPNDPEAWARFYKSAFDVGFFMAGVGNGRRLYETWGEGWEDLQLGRTHNPFRLLFRKPKE